MTELQIEPARPQKPLPDEPYDRWVLPDGEVKAEFRRVERGFHVRFPNEADFEILEEYPARVTVWPAPDQTAEWAETLYRNAILPLVANHHGGLCLHGSAVALNGSAIALIGPSNSGKTTLAGALARAGAPYLTEDVLELVRQGESYFVQPKEQALRLYPDSAEYLLGHNPDRDAEDDKSAVSEPEKIPFCNIAQPLGALIFLGSEAAAETQITRLAAKDALAQLMPNAFILDVEDKDRLASHFDRLSGLAQRMPSFELDYLRQFSELETVIGAIKLELVADREHG